MTINKIITEFIMLIIIAEVALFISLVALDVMGIATVYPFAAVILGGIYLVVITLILGVIMYLLKRM